MQKIKHKAMISEKMKHYNLSLLPLLPYSYEFYPALYMFV